MDGLDRPPKTHGVPGVGPDAPGEARVDLERLRPDERVEGRRDELADDLLEIAELL